VRGKTGNDARFRIRPERPDPVAHQTVQRMVVLVDRRRADTMGGRVVLTGDGSARGVVTVILMRADRCAPDDGIRQHRGDRDVRRPGAKPLQHLSDTA
jgi:hypothetical protein